MDECDRPGYEPGSGRGFCRKHYKRIVRYGDPMVTKRVRNRCTVEDCDGLVVGNGLCSKHYTRMKRHGTTDHPQKWANAPEGTKWCPRCQTYRTASAFTPDKQKRDGLASWCKPCMAANARELRQREPSIYLRLKVAAACVQCGSAFLADKRRTLHCSTECRRAGKKRADLVYQLRFPERHSEANRRYRLRFPHKGREKSRMYRARKAAATVEPVPEKRVFERDGWICRICGEEIDRTLIWPDPMSPSLDHIMPLVRGGPHTMANCQAAHLVCNLRKGDRITP